MKLSFHCNIPAPIEEVYEYVTAMGPTGTVDQALFVQKYGEPVQEVDGAVLTPRYGGRRRSAVALHFHLPGTTHHGGH